MTFEIKALGDHTSELANTLAVGQSLTVEGPYGCFDIARCDPQARQIWIAGGIGVTPFIAWLESLQHHPARQYSADLHYFVRDAATDPFAVRLESLCATLPGIKVYIHSDDWGNALANATLFDESVQQGRSEVWFCGPKGLADMLKGRFRQVWQKRYTFHQEAFEMR